MINARSSAGIDFVSTGSHPSDGPRAIQPGDRIQVAPGKVYEYTGTSPRGPPPADYATDPDFLLVSSVTAGGSISVHAEDAAEIVAIGRGDRHLHGAEHGWHRPRGRPLTAAQTDYQFTAHSGVQHVKPGNLARADDGKVYRYVGPDDETLRLRCRPSSRTSVSGAWSIRFSRPTTT